MFPPAGNSENKIAWRGRIQISGNYRSAYQPNGILLFKYNIIIFYLLDLTLLDNTVIF